MYSVNCESIAAPSVPDPTDTEYSEPSVPHLSRNLAGAQLFDLHCRRLSQPERRTARRRATPGWRHRAASGRGRRLPIFGCVRFAGRRLDAGQRHAVSHRPPTRSMFAQARPGRRLAPAKQKPAPSPTTSAKLNYLEALVRNREPAVRSDFDVYLGEIRWSMSGSRAPRPTPRHRSFCTCSPST